MQKKQSTFDQEEREAKLEKIILNFLNVLEQRVSKLDNALAVGDLSTAKAVSHQLKGAGLFGYDLLSSLAKELEQELLSDGLRINEIFTQLKEAAQAANQSRLSIKKQLAPSV